MSNNYYVDNEEFEKEIIKFQDKLKIYHDSLGKDRKEMSDPEKYGLHLASSKLCKIFMDMTDNILKSGKYYELPYDLKQDISSYVIYEMIKVMRSYDRNYFRDKEGKKPNPFGFYTRSIKLCIAKALCKYNEQKAKNTELILFLDDLSIDFGNEEDNDNFKVNANNTRDYIHSLDGENLHYYTKTKKRLPKQKLKAENIESLKSLVLGINQYIN